MSFQSDYILRMIEMMGDLMAALMGKIRRKDFEKANDQLEESYTEFLKEDAAFFRSLPIEGMTDSLLNDHNYTHDHLQILAELFYAEAELQLARNKKNDAKLFFEKSLKLNEYLDLAYKTYDEARIKKIELLNQQIRNCGL